MVFILALGMTPRELAIPSRKRALFAATYNCPPETTIQKHRLVIAVIYLCLEVYIRSEMGAGLGLSLLRVFFFFFFLDFV